MPNIYLITPMSLRCALSKFGLRSYAKCVTWQSTSNASLDQMEKYAKIGTVLMQRYCVSKASQIKKRNLCFTKRWNLRPRCSLETTYIQGQYITLPNLV